MDFNLKTFASILLFGVLGTIIAGIAVYGIRIFDVNSPLFQFVSYGFAGSMAFGLFYFRKYFISIPLHLILFFGIFILSGRQFLLTHIYYYVSLLLTLFIFSVLIFDHLKLAKFLRPVILATMLSIFFVSNTFLLSLIHSQAITSALVFKNMFIGLLIGAGLGLGIESTCRIFGKGTDETEQD